MRKVDKKIEIEYLAIDSIVPSDENPNIQNDKTFTALVDSIRADGMFDPIDVVPFEDGKYKLIGGEHRYRACDLLGYEDIACIVHKDFDEDKQKAMLVKLNMLRGKIDSNKFVLLYNSLSVKYNDEVLMTMMGIAEEEAFKNMVKSVGDNLPDEIREKAKEKIKDVKNVDDLAVILNQLFREHGNSLDYSFMVFDFGGKRHLWVQMDEELYNIMESVKKESIEKSENINSILKKRFFQAN